ncbi:hypothetical protein [Saccharicrinis sp. 156]|uniref:hypothetical protein n=1 Tax=Saccharicrinis sp. 156 TaxID=3417574 RepID=UPI003D35928D
MKRQRPFILIALLGLVLLFPCMTLAQAPEKLSYQAVARDAGNNLINNTTVGMRISILQGTVSGSAVYVETHTPTTNDNGLVSVEIGAGITTHIFTSINWADGPYFIKTETDPEGGSNYTISGTSQLLSVPYALYAKTADSAVNYDETDPGVGINTLNYLSKWDGSALVASSIFDDGDVGIGTLDPADKLHVNGSLRLSYNNYVRADGNYGFLGLSGGDGWISTGGIIQLFGASSSADYANSIRFLNNSGEVMRIAGGTGYVGINTSEPEEELDVNGGIRANEYVTGGDDQNYHKYKLLRNLTGYAIGVSYGDQLGSVNSWSNAYTWRGASEGYGWLWRNYEGIGWMSLSSYDGRFYLQGKAQFNDDVGIGTDNPGARLEVAERPDATNDPVAIRLTNLRSPHDLFWEMRAYDSGAGGPYGRFSIFGGYSGGSDMFVVTTTGNVGIGTIDPKTKLQVVGLPEYADNAAALAAGLTIGAFYRTGDLLKVVH